MINNRQQTGKIAIVALMFAIHILSVLWLLTRPLPGGSSQEGEG